MEKRYLIGVDVGTTGTKALLFSQEGELIAQAYQAYPILTPQNGYVEQNAQDWWEAVVKTVRQVCQGRDIQNQVAAISLSTQGGTVVPVDASGTPLRTGIVWNDSRCSQQMQSYIVEQGPAATMYEKTGWNLMPGLPAMQIRWLRENQPKIFEKTAKFLTVPDYLSMKMTGIAAVDPSNAGINQLTDIHITVYDESLLRFAGISTEQLPSILSSGSVIGNLTPEAAAALELSTDTLLVAGAHDQYAVALGAGALKSGAVLIGSGTCWVVTAIEDKPNFPSGLSQSISAVPGLWGSLYSLSSGGICLDWLRKNIALGKDGQPLDYDTLNEEIAQRKAAEEGLFFYPFSGIGDGKNTFTKATFTGLDLYHDRFHMARAIMEGVAFQIAWILETFSPSQAEVALTGGASRSRVWSQILADISGRPIRVPQVADLACVGAAILAGTGCGIYQTPEEGYGKLAVCEQIIYPDLVRTKMYADLIKKYKQQANGLYKIYST